MTVSQYVYAAAQYCLKNGNLILPADDAPEFLLSKVGPEYYLTWEEESEVNKKPPTQEEIKKELKNQASSLAISYDNAHKAYLESLVSAAEAFIRKNDNLTQNQITNYIKNAQMNNTKIYPLYPKDSHERGLTEIILQHQRVVGLFSERKI